MYCFWISKYFKFYASILKRTSYNISSIIISYDFFKPIFSLAFKNQSTIYSISMTSSSTMVNNPIFSHSLIGGSNLTSSKTLVLQTNVLTKCNHRFFGIIALHLQNLECLQSLNHQYTFDYLNLVSLY
ncbi:Uncharacterised protein [Staphylococcus aureus]|uniref:Uncharacterized protein n=1 Tax=Staphylococcus aureus TaxID=1280 RepID=A0A2X2KGZ0_STAAU|nr:Uncharacterised protein [Staphylococcus aureus]